MKMKAFKTQFLLWATMLLCLTTLNGCDEDLWYDNVDMVGTWQVDNVGGDLDYCRYRYGDVFTFDSNGQFFTRGNQLNENGYWNYRNANSVRIYLEPYPNDVCMYGEIDADWNGERSVTLRIKDVADPRYPVYYQIHLVRLY